MKPVCSYRHYQTARIWKDGDDFRASVKKEWFHAVCVNLSGTMDSFYEFLLNKN